MFTIYSTTTCAYCQMVKKFFTLNGVDYKEINLDEAPELRQHALDLSGMTSVPVVTKTENSEESLVCVGWNPQKLMAAI